MLWGVIVAIVVIIIFVIAVYPNKTNKRDSRHSATESMNKLNEIRRSYDEIKKDWNVPENCDFITIKGASHKSSIKLHKGDYYLWKDKADLCFFELEPIIDDVISGRLKKYEITRLPIRNIDNYNMEGELHCETRISGGGGGGYSLTGAVVGGIIAGGVGAVIGSRKKTDPIVSKTITYDDRICYLNYFDNSGVIQSLYLIMENMKILKRIIPKKNYDFVMKNIIMKDSSKIQSSADEIRKFALLRDEEIITPEEFERKKNELL